MERTIFTWNSMYMAWADMAWADLAWISPRERRGWGTLCCQCAQADPRSVLPTCPFPSSLPAQLTKRVLPTRGGQALLTHRVLEGLKEERLTGVSQPSVVCQESNVKFFKQLCFSGDVAPRTRLLLLRSATVPKGHRVDPKECPLALSLEFTDGFREK